MKEVSEDVWVIAQDLYNDADFNINRYGEVESFTVMSFDDYNVDYGDCKKSDYEEAKAYLDELLKDVKYYDSYLELNDNHTLWDIEIPEGTEFNDEEYSFLYDQALEGLEEEIGEEVYGLGRSGRHICVADTFRNLTKLDTFKEAQERWEKWLIDTVISSAKENSGATVEESLNKGEKKARCLSCGADVVYTNRDVCHDIDGDYIECPNCNATFDVDYDAITPLLNKKIESEKQDLYVYTDANSYDKDEVEGNIYNYKQEAPNLEFKVYKQDDIYYVEFIGTKEDLIDYLTKLNWYTREEINDLDLLKSYNKNVKTESYEVWQKYFEDGEIARPEYVQTFATFEEAQKFVNGLNEDPNCEAWIKELKESKKVTEAEDMEAVKDDVKSAVEKSDSTKQEKDQVKGSIDVLKTDEESAIDGYEEFNKETAKVVDKELADTIDDQMQEIVDDEKEHIEKLDTIKSALGESKKYAIYVTYGGDGVYTSKLVDTVDTEEQAVDRVAELQSTGVGASYKELDESKKEETLGESERGYITGEVEAIIDGMTDLDKSQITGKLIDDVVNIVSDEKVDIESPEFDERVTSIVRNILDNGKKEELFNNSINLNVDAGDIASNNNVDLGGLGELVGLMASEETKESEDKLEEAEETSGTASIDLHTDLVPIINMYQYDIYNMLDDYVGIKREALDEMMLEFAEPIIEEQIKEVLPSAQITFGEFTHPQYYRLFSNLNDILEFTVTYNVSEYEALKEKAIQDPAFEQYLKDHYTSYDGFMSFFANNIRDFQEQEDWKQFVSVLSYYLPNNEEENYNEMCNYIYENASNYDIMPIDSEVEYVVDEINNKVSNGEIELNRENVISATKDLMSYLDEDDQEIIINGVLDAFNLEEGKKVEGVTPEAQKVSFYTFRVAEEMYNSEHEDTWQDLDDDTKAEYYNEHFPTIFKLAKQRAENKKEELFDNTADININANDVASNNNVDLGGLGDLLGMTEAKAIEMKKTENKEEVND